MIERKKYEVIEMGKLNIREEEDILFREWKAELALEEGQLFVKDGMVCPEKFENILFIMKEVHSEDGEKEWELRDKIQNDSDGHTWNNVARWTIGLISGFAVPWEEVESMNLSLRSDQLLKIATMNVKKISGKAVSNTREIRKFANKDEYFLGKQLGLYMENYPLNYVLCCGDGVGGGFMDAVFPVEGEQITSNGVRYRVKGETV